MKRISIVCCYNKYEVYQYVLKESLMKQNEDHEMIGIDNTNAQFTSCAAAFNSVIDHIKTEFVMFVHQDIKFQDSEFLEKLVQYLEQQEGIFGVAGADSKGRYSSVLEGKDGHVSCGGSEVLKESQMVQTLDECLFACKTKNVQQIRFDELTCDNWHLYGVDLSLAFHKVGISSYVVPLIVYHLSSGKVNRDFYRIMVRLCNKYRNSYKEIYTTCIRMRHMGTCYVLFYNLYHWVSRKVILRIINGKLRRNYGTV